MARMVVLEHQAEGRPDHFDWLIQRPGEEDAGPDERRLIALRVTIRPDDPRAVVFQAQRAEEHRVVYLDFEGEISEGRGRVRRVAWGWVSRVDSAPGSIVIAGEFEGQLGEKDPPQMVWRITRVGYVWLAQRDVRV